MTRSILIPLCDMPVGSRFVIQRLDIEGTMRRRLLDLGFIPGGEVLVLQKSPLGDPVAYQVSQTTIALRKEESAKIWGTMINDE